MKELMITKLTKETEDAPPILKLSNGVGLLNFRGHYWTTECCTLNGSNHNQINSERLNCKPIEAVISILKGIGIEKDKFTKKEIKLINEWVEETYKYYMF